MKMISLLMYSVSASTILDGLNDELNAQTAENPQHSNEFLIKSENPKRTYLKHILSQNPEAVVETPKTSKFSLEVSAVWMEGDYDWKNYNTLNNNRRIRRSPRFFSESLKFSRSTQQLSQGRHNSEHMFSSEGDYKYTNFVDLSMIRLSRHKSESKNPFFNVNGGIETLTECTTDLNEDKAALTGGACGGPEDVCTHEIIYHENPEEQDNYSFVPIDQKSFQSN